MDAEDDDSNFHSAGTLNTPSASRARMLAQQRELQLKKRQNSVQTGGIASISFVRSNNWY